MNKKFYSLIAAALVSVASFAQADYSLYIEDATVTAGTTAKLNLMMTNKTDVCLAQCDIFLPSAFSWKLNSKGNPTMTADRSRDTYVEDEDSGEKTYDHSVATGLQKAVDATYVQAYQDKAATLFAADKVARFLEMSNTNANFVGNSGRIAIPNVDIPADAVNGDYEINVWCQCLVDKAVNSYGQGWTTAKITVTGGTGINGIKEDVANGAIYNLNGQRVNKAQKGIFIQNGKKVATK